MIDPGLVKYTKHALFQMNMRNITEEEVILTLGYPDEVSRGSHTNETIAKKSFGRKRVRVIYVSEPVEIRIITVTL